MELVFRANTSWLADWGVPTSIVYGLLAEDINQIGTVGMATALLVRRRLDEVAPTVGYDPSKVLQAVVGDWLLWHEVVRDIRKQPAKKYLRDLENRGIVNSTVCMWEPREPWVPVP